MKFISTVIEKIINCITFEESDGIMLELNSFILENRLFFSSSKFLNLYKLFFLSFSIHKYYEKLIAIEKTTVTNKISTASQFEFKSLFLSIENIDTLVFAIEEKINQTANQILIPTNLQKKIIE